MREKRLNKTLDEFWVVKLSKVFQK
jgi:hypothetical protein